MATPIDQNDGFLQFIATGGETNVDWDWPLFAKDQLTILETDLDGVISQLVLGTDYTIADDQLEVEAGGAAVLDGTAYPTGAIAGYKYTALMNPPVERQTDFNQAGDFFADTLNRELDLIIQMMQAIRRDLAKTAQLPPDSTLASLFLPQPEAGHGLMWNDTADGLVNTQYAMEDLAGYLATVSAISGEIVIVAGIEQEIQDVAANASNINTVAASITNVNAVGGNIGSVNAVAANETNVNTVATNIGNVNLTGANIANVNATGGSIANVNTVAGSIANVNTVAASNTSLNTVATNIASVNAVAGIEGDVTTVAGMESDISAVVANMADIQAAPAAAATAVAAKDDAVDAQGYAEEWAINPENDPVSVDAGGDGVTTFSALHWAKKAQNAVTGNLTYQGAWDASGGTYPPSPNLGDYYKVTVAGTISGVDFGVGDSMIYNGTDWDKLDNSDAVASVAGKTGVVTLSTGDISGLGALATQGDGDKGDVTVSASGATWTVNNDAITAVKLNNNAVTSTKIANSNVTFAKLENLANQRLIGRNSSGTGVPESININNVLGWISNTQGATLYRGASVWSALAPGTAGQVLTMNSGATEPEWKDPAGGGAPYTNFVLLTSGTSWNVPAGVGQIMFGMVAGGGASGAVDSPGGLAQGGTNGEEFTGFMEVTPGGTLSYSIGAGGTAGSGIDGGNGGDTVLGSLTARGGIGGLKGAGNASQVPQSPLSASGVVPTSGLTITSSRGRMTERGAPPNNVGVSNPTGGGSSSMGVGGAELSGVGDGNAATGYGSGGGGAWGGGAKNGVNGQPGAIWIRY